MSLIAAEQDDEAVMRAEDEAIAAADKEPDIDVALTALEEILRGPKADLHAEAEAVGDTGG